MVDPVDRAPVRVSSGGRPVGAGRLVGEGLVVTCAHVLGDEVEVDFPAPGGDRSPATVVHAPEGVDLVGLRVDDVPAAARPARVVAVDEVRDHRVRAFGVPAQRDHGVWSRGVVRGPIADGMTRVEDDRDHGVPLLRGFSGSPLIDENPDAPPVAVTAPGPFTSGRRSPPEAVSLREVLPSGEVVVLNSAGEPVVLDARGGTGTGGALVDHGGVEPVSGSCDDSLPVLRGLLSGRELARCEGEDAGYCDSAAFTADGR